MFQISFFMLIVGIVLWNWRYLLRFGVCTAIASDHDVLHEMERARQDLVCKGCMAFCSSINVAQQRHTWPALGFDRLYSNVRSATPDTSFSI